MVAFTHRALQVVGLILSSVYFLWLGVLIVRSLAHIDQMNPEYIFIMVITLVTIIGAMAAVYTGALAPDQVRLHTDMRKDGRFQRTKPPLLLPRRR